MIRNECARAETLAGAIALGEASETERDEYRRHLAGCAPCIATLGGEREIERVMDVVVQAREAETWEPDVRSDLARRRSGGRRAWSIGLSAAACAVVASFGIHALIAMGVPTLAPLAKDPIVVSYNGQHITVEHDRAAAAQIARNATASRDAAAPHGALVVEHNVVTLNRPAAASRAAGRPAAPPASNASAAQPQPAARPVHPEIDPTQVAALTPNAGDERAIAAFQTAATSAPPQARAESIAMMPSAAETRNTVIHDAAPLGGESAIVPHPSAIAYDEGAEGITNYEVSVDERGMPVKCTIVKSSGYMVLDVAVCKAAMHAKYSPRTINGKAVAGVYRDAFVFRSHE